MRAIVHDAPGSPDVLRLADVPLPERYGSEFLVRVHAAGLNPIDTKTRAGRGAAAGIRSYPAILGQDFSGVVVASPYEAHPLQPGAEVFGMVSVPRYPGTFAEYVAVPELSLTRKPASLSHLEAAALPVAALTAWGAVVDVAHAQAGQRMLIHAGSGGVGHFAVQFASLRGAHVIATGSARNLDWLRSLGAAEVIDYSAQRFEEVARGVDAVIDLIGNVYDDTGTRSLAVLRWGGLLVNIPSGSWPNLIADAAAAGIRATHYKVAPDARTLATIAALVETGDVHVEIDSVFDLADAAAAHRALETGHTRGKIVARVVC
ncbi:NADP-dependent oxidoreductase [Rathayibacter soli]|uniref:NADP-dependent oxidoreductase n=1 Tax=Rathayibacter soli TaxID=3144168 RepID=UPI0027E57530|nr:NADP-dependent oxidoreductase [Glaciibacter superstes]